MPVTKDAYYFPHDYEPIGDQKILALISDHGAAGYGLYWRIIEMLHSETTHKLEMKPMLYKAIAKQMESNAEQLLKFINDCIKEYYLFQSDGIFFWSDRVNRNIERREEVSKVRSIAGKKGYVAKQNSANAKQMLAIAKQRKEKKENIIPAAPDGALYEGRFHETQTGN